MSSLAATVVVPLYAGFWRRAAAATLDGLILVIPAVIVALVTSDGVVRHVLNIVVGCSYYAGFHSSSWQATPGKKAFGIKVTNYEGGRIGLGRAIGRYFAIWLSAIILGIGFLLAAFTQKRQALHDMICSTFVVNGSAQPNDVVAGGGVMPLTTGVWVVVIVLLIVPFFGGMLAAIAIPAYQDYTLRVKVNEVTEASRPLRQDVERAISEKRTWTVGAVQIGSKYASSAEVTQQGDVVVNLSGDISRDGRIRFTPSASSSGVQWKCSGENIRKAILPAACRE